MVAFSSQEKEETRIGVYICHCGTNIAGVVKVEDVAKYAATLPNVVVAKNYLYMCSAPAQAMIKEDIKTHRLNRVVVASCSPRMHEPTFRKVCEEGGLNPYLFEMTNIREQCSWVHPSQPEKATEKAKDLIRMSVDKARLLESLQKREVSVVARALVVGAGIAGMKAALDLAQRDFEVYLVEKSPNVGGHTARLHLLYPTGEQAIEVLKPLMNEVLSNSKIKLFTNSEVSTVDGFIGNFKVKFKVNPQYVTENCDACGKCEEACPIEVPDEFNYGLRKRKAIYLPFRDVAPKTYVIDDKNCNRCGECAKVCPKKAISLEEGFREVEADVGTIILAIGHDTYVPPEGEYGYGVCGNVITQPQLERLLDKNGPTNGQLIFNGSTPKRIVFISCVGARQEPGVYKPLKEDQKLNTYCSRVCCTETLKNTIEIKNAYPDSQVFYLCRDIRSYGKGHEEYYRKAGESRVFFFKYELEEPPVVSNGPNGTIVTVHDVLSDETFAIPADLVVLNVSMIPPRDASDVQTKLKVARGADGFFQEAHAKLRPLETPSDGIYLAGTAQGPKDITDSSAMGSAAAAKAVIPLARGKVEVEPIVAAVDEHLCKGCGRCEEVCEYGAINVKETEPVAKVPTLVAKVTEAQCKGCGSCAVACPTRAITMKHFTDKQVNAMVTAAIGG